MDPNQRNSCAIHETDRDKVGQTFGLDTGCSDWRKVAQESSHLREKGLLRQTVLKDGETHVKEKSKKTQNDEKKQRKNLEIYGQWKLKPGFINRVLVDVIFEASKCL